MSYKDILMKDDQNTILTQIYRGITMKQFILALTVLLTAAVSAYTADPSVTLRFNYSIAFTGKASQVRFTASIPQLAEGRLQILESRIEARPNQAVFNRNFKVEDNRYMEVVMNNPPLTLQLELVYKLNVYEYDYFVASKQRNNIFQSDYFLKPFLKSEDGIETANSAISNKAAGFKTKDQEETLKKIFNFVAENITLKDYDGKNPTALETLEKGEANAAGIAALFTALCRSAGLPARPVIGLRTDKKSNPAHFWAEIYLDKYGWVPFDPSLVKEGVSTYERMKPVYVPLSYTWNDSVLGGARFSAGKATGNGIIEKIDHVFTVD